MDKCTIGGRAGEVSQVVQRMRDECRVLSELAHPRVVKMIEIAESPHCVYIVMQNAAGGALLERILERGVFSEANAKHVMRQVLEVLSFMHAHGVIHRDIKPENILLEAPDRWDVVLTDFGLVKIFSDRDSLATSMPRAGSLQLLDSGGRRPHGPSFGMPGGSGTTLQASAQHGAPSFGMPGGSGTSSLAPSSTRHASAQHGASSSTLAFQTTLERCATRVGGSPFYQAPEQVYCTAPYPTTYGAGVDVWSSGVVLYILLSGTFPFDEASIPPPPFDEASIPPPPLAAAAERVEGRRDGRRDGAAAAAAAAGTAAGRGADHAAAIAAKAAQTWNADRERRGLINDASSVPIRSRHRPDDAIGLISDPDGGGGEGVRGTAKHWPSGASSPSVPIPVPGVTPPPPAAFAPSRASGSGNFHSFPAERFETVSESARDAINAMLSVDPRRRPTAETMCRHPWLLVDAQDDASLPPTGVLKASSLSASYLVDMAFTVRLAKRAREAAHEGLRSGSFGPYGSSFESDGPDARYGASFGTSFGARDGASFDDRDGASFLLEGSPVRGGCGALSAHISGKDSGKVSAHPLKMARQQGGFERLEAKPALN
jgi:serine/threonine protein kinase